MSTLDELKNPRRGTPDRPTAFELLQKRPDWQTATPAAEDERKWYFVGYQMATDIEINDPVSPVVPVTHRIWFALGLADAKAGSKPRAEWSKRQPEESSLFPAILGGVAGLTGAGLLVWASRRRAPSGGNHGSG